MADISIRDKLEVAVPVATVLAGALVLLPWITSNRALNKFPLHGEELGTAAKRRTAFLKDAAELHKTGYAKFRDAIYRLTETEGDLLIVPIGYLDELRKLPDSILSNAEAQKDTLQTHYLDFAVDDPLMNHVIRSDLTHKLPSLNDKLSAEVAQAVPEYFGKSREWTAINVNNTMLKVVAVVSGHIFLGPELNRHEEYLHASINFTVDLVKAASQIRAWSPWLRPIGRYFVPGINTVNDHRRRAKEFLVPIIEERRVRRAVQGGSEEPDDMLQWMLAKAENFGTPDAGHLAETQLTLSMAAIHTTTMMVTYVLYDLTAHCPEVIPELKAEIQAVLAENDGVMTTQALFQMKLLDSVMRESQRFSPVSVGAFRRAVLHDITLSDGTVLPRGSRLVVPQQGVNMDPELYPEPEKYNPYRFRDIRSGAAADKLGYSNTEQYQFISVNKEHTGFGFGRHACPGRFFASNEIKLILAQIFVNYEVKMPPGETNRYPNIIQVGTIVPDPSKNLMFRYVGK
ncbi:ent-kaurene oxidase [Microdochium nivale]|nr:ent-kaurene oxidase [Microdochium nivale]